MHVRIIFKSDCKKDKRNDPRNGDFAIKFYVGVPFACFNRMFGGKLSL